MYFTHPGGRGLLLSLTLLYEDADADADAFTKVVLGTALPKKLLKKAMFI
jgi:hypothetical protein